MNLLSACPFLGARREASDPGNSVAKGKCPFGFVSSASSSRDGRPDTTPAEAPPVPEAPSSAAQAPAIPAPAPATAASCPYGFSSAASVGQAMSVLHCVLCKQWMHDAVQVRPCQHRYCAFCISSTKDCPVCGCDIEGMDKDEKTQGLVDTLLAAHVTVANQQQQGGDASLDIAPASAPTPALPPVMAGATPSASCSLLLHLGLQALRGGNPVSALHRLEVCKTELLQGAGDSPVPHTGPTSDQQQSTDAAQQEGQAHQEQGLTDAGQDNQPNNASELPPEALQKQQQGGDEACSTQPGQEPDAEEKQQGLQLDALLKRCMPASGEGLELPPLCGDLGARLRLVPPAHLPASLACPLGAVFGSQGDAAKQLGALGAAAALYAAGALCLKGAAEAGDDEAAHALSVSINKLGDVRYLSQDLPVAREAYEAALHVRRRRLDRAQGQQTTTNKGTEWDLVGLHAGCAAQALDCAASLIKVADVCSAMDLMREATEACAHAQGIISACERLLAQADRVNGGSAGDLGAADLVLQQRCQQLSSVLQGMQQSLPECAPKVKRGIAEHSCMAVESPESPVEKQRSGT